VAVIGAAAGYFLASAGAPEARALAAEVFARGGARLSAALQRALARPSGSAWAPEELDEAENIVAQAARQERAALESVLTLAPGDAALRTTVETLLGHLRAREEEARLLLAQLRPVAAAQTAAPSAALGAVPRRVASAAGPLSVYYYDFFEDRGIANVPGDGLFQYEALNLVDGRRTLGEIRLVLDGSYGPTTAEDVVRYFEILEKAGVVTLERR